ncbi:unnamed protein product, partial [Didymodactylos carnosus]
MANWTVEQVLDWLILNDFDKHVKLFKDENIDGTALFGLNDEEIEQLLLTTREDGTMRKPTIGAKARFRTKLQEWKSEQQQQQLETERLQQIPQQPQLDRTEQSEKIQQQSQESKEKSKKRKKSISRPSDQPSFVATPRIRSSAVTASPTAKRIDTSRILTSTTTAVVSSGETVPSTNNTIEPEIPNMSKTFFIEPMQTMLNFFKNPSFCLKLKKYLSKTYKINCQIPAIEEQDKEVGLHLKLSGNVKQDVKSTREYLKQLIESVQTKTYNDEKKHEK